MIEPLRLSFDLHCSPVAALSIRFAAHGSATRVEIGHTGRERLGRKGPEWRNRNRSRRETLLPHFQAVIPEKEVSS